MSGDTEVEVLHGINLSVRKGEMLAIIGPSGSGKSTLMNIIGCLDTPSSGNYFVMGKDTHNMLHDELTSLRRDFFGFIFQRYHLLGHLCARENVQVPSVYAGVPKKKRDERALKLLEDLGLSHRSEYRPAQLSGGQQQRVSIARALMNGGRIILADEPTGALDSKSGRDVMNTLQELNSQGHTVIIVTHDPRIAACAKRVISIEDGSITSDIINEHPAKFELHMDGSNEDTQASEQVSSHSESSANAQGGKPTATHEPQTHAPSKHVPSIETSTLASSHAPGMHASSHDERDEQYTRVATNTAAATTSTSTQETADTLFAYGSKGNPWLFKVHAYTDRFKEAFVMAYRAMLSNRMRTLLTMLGIIIGIMAVVTVVALARGASEQIISNIAAMGTNTITVYPGQGMGDVRRGRIQTLTPRDLNALQGQPFVDSVSATVQTNALLRRGQKEANATIQGVSSEMFRVYGLELKKGRLFNEIELKSNAQVGVIDDNTAKLFFATEDPLGKTIIIGNVVIRVIGVLAKSDSWVIRGTNPTVFVPYTSVMTRLVNQNYLSSIVLRINDGFAAPVAENAIKSILVTRHGREDFFMQSSDTIMKSIENATRTFTLMISAIAVISLVVGGIGVMNIMLVSVTERTKEIGIRMAVGAGRGDILSQFLIEAVMVCLIGGLLGVVLSYIAGHLIMHFAPNIVLSYSLTSVIAAVMTSSVIGIVFGFMPARSASRLNPIDALARE
ncbi:MAG: MacB family efflux pump subunit [Anaerobiospirillum succiniciproducens]|uniref:MacB family efflux pump subunit n=1 Tax=Anaerobiospirillum succiniciproducens TaxID=13335 RepID=UPI002356CB45|nr:MacB family efflux pump subunit [Anaerobiospirillum succiniciproducens]MDY2798554.1 MacB family efflux pump subunit [Anaerobiospirillum succiniciproducens]